MFVDRQVLPSRPTEAIAYIRRAVQENFPTYISSEKRGFYGNDGQNKISDSTEALLAAMAQHVVPQDIVLTTPAHLHLFLQTVQHVNVFDISPAQLVDSKNLFPKLSSARSRWWCDVFDSSLLHKMLSSIQPTVLYLSNIHQYCDGDRGEDMSLLSPLVQTCVDQRSLRVVMFARHINTPETATMCSLFTENYWAIQDYPTTQFEFDTSDYDILATNLYVAVRG